MTSSHPISPEDTAVARYRDLVRQLGKELGEGRGWKSAAARVLGVDQSLVGRVLAGKRGVSRDLIDRAARNLDISTDYFYGDYEGQRDYRLFLDRQESDGDDGWGDESTIADGAGILGTYPEPHRKHPIVLELVRDYPKMSPEHQWVLHKNVEFLGPRATRTLLIKLWHALVAEENEFPRLDSA